MGFFSNFSSSWNKKQEDEEKRTTSSYETNSRPATSSSSWYTAPGQGVNRNRTVVQPTVTQPTVAQPKQSFFTRLTNNMQSGQMPQVRQPQTAYQQNLARPVNNSNRWTVGMEPTNYGQVIASICNTAKTDQNLAAQQMTMLRQLQTDSTSMFYNPYAQATNSAVQNLKSYGIDASMLTDDWLQTSGWQSALQFNGTTNTPSKPSKKSSKAEWAAYEIYQYAIAEDRTKKAEAEWAAMQQEAAYWASRDDLNLSDDDIVKRIQSSMGKKYKTLQTMQDDIDNHKQYGLLEMNRGIGYSKDALYGVIWAARNDGGSGSLDGDIARYWMGEGNQREENEEIARKLKKSDRDTYAPYSVGMTLDDQGLYFNRKYFDQQWLDENRWMLDSDDETLRKNYIAVQKAELYTQKLEKELADMHADIDSLLEYCTDPQMIIDAIYDTSDYKDLFDLDDTLLTGELKGTTRAVDYRRQDIEQYIRDKVAQKNGTGSLDQLEAAASTTPVGTPAALPEVPQDAYVGLDTNDTVAPPDAVPLQPPTWADLTDWEVDPKKQGNIDLGAYEPYIPPDGKPKNADIATWWYDQNEKKYVVLPTSPGGQYLTDTEDIVDRYRATGEYFGKMDSEEEADAYIDRLNGIFQRKAGEDKRTETGAYYGRGNIDLNNRPVYEQPDGSFSTENSITISEGEYKHILIPTIINGKQVSDDEAINHYYETGENLGIFSDPEEAEEYAERLHERQEARYIRPGAEPGPAPAGPAPTPHPEEPEEEEEEPPEAVTTPAPETEPPRQPKDRVRGTPEPTSTPRPPESVYTGEPVADEEKPGRSVTTPPPTASNDTERELDRAAVDNMAAAGPTIRNKGTDAEKAAFKTSMTSRFLSAVETLTNSVRDGIEWFSHEADKKIGNDYMGSLQSMGEYESHVEKRNKISDDLDEINARIEELQQRQEDSDVMADLSAEDMRRIRDAMTSNPEKVDPEWPEARSILESGDENDPDFEWALGTFYRLVHPERGYASMATPEEHTEMLRTAWREWSFVTRNEATPVEKLIQSNSNQSPEDTDIITEEVPIPGTNGASLEIDLTWGEDGSLQFMGATNTFTGETYKASQLDEVNGILGYREPLSEDEKIELADLETRRSGAEEQLRLENEYLVDEKEMYDQASRTKTRAEKAYLLANGLKTGSLDTTLLNKMDYLYQVAKEGFVPEYQPDNYLDMMVQAGELTREQASAKAPTLIMNDLAVAGLLQSTLDEITRMGVTIPDDMKNSLNARIKYLNEEARSTAYLVYDSMPDAEDLAVEGHRMAASGKYGGLAKSIASGKYTPGDLSSGSVDMEDEYATLSDQDYRSSLIASMTPEEKNRFFIILAKDGKDAAKEYWNMLTNEENGVLVTRRSINNAEMVEEFASQNFWTGAAATAYSFMSNVRAGSSALTYEVVQNLRGKGINPYSKEFDDLIETQAARAGVKDQITRAFGKGTFGDVVGNILFDGFTSSMDSWINAQMMEGLFTVTKSFFSPEFIDRVSDVVNAVTEGPGLGARTNAFIVKASGDLSMASTMGLSAAASTYREVIVNHGTKDQALRMAVATFFAETGSEAITVSNFHSAYAAGKESAAAGLKGLLIEFFKNGAEEALGEGANEWIEQWADRIIMQDLSDYEQIVKKYQDMRYPDSVAYEMADRELWKNVLTSAATGFVSSAFGTAAEATRGAVESKAPASEARPAAPSEVTSAVAPADEATVAATVEPGVREQYAKDMAILESASVLNPTATSAAVTTVLGGDHAARAASQAMIETFGSTEGTARVIQDILSVVPGDTTAVKRDIVNAALTSGKGNEALQEVAYKYASGQEITLEDVNAITEGLKQDAAEMGDRFGQTIFNAVKESRIATRVAELFQNGEARASVETAKAQVTQAKENLDTATKQYDQAQKNVDNTTAALESAIDEQLKDPTEDSLSAPVQQLAEQLESDTIDLGAKEEAVRGAQDNVAKAQENLSLEEDKWLNSTREQATAEVEQELLQEQQAEAERLQQEQAAEEERIQQEAVRQKEEERQSVEAQIFEDDLNTFIETNYPDATPEEKQRLREIMQRQVETRREEATGTETQPATPGDNHLRVEDLDEENRSKLFGMLGSKYGLSFEIADETPFKAPGYTDPETGKIVLNRNATVGDVFRLTLFHEMSHQAENSKTYRKMANALLGLAYGKGVSYSKVLREMESGEPTSTLARDALERKAYYEKTLGKEVSNEYALQEIVGDEVGNLFKYDPNNPQAQEDLINRLVSEEPSTARRILDSIKRFLKSMVGIKGTWADDANRVVGLLEKSLLQAKQNRAVNPLTTGPYSETLANRTGDILNSPYSGYASPGTRSGAEAASILPVYPEASPSQEVIQDPYSDNRGPEANPIAETNDGEPLANEFRGGTVTLGDTTRFNLKTFTEDEGRIRDSLLNAKDEDGNPRFTPEDVNKYLGDATGIAAMIAADPARLDFEMNDNPNIKFLKKNSEYFFSLDASTLCAKRLLYQGTFNYVQHALPDEVFTPADLVDLANIMRDMGYETPCGICYVESRRRWLDTYANQFLETLPEEGRPSLDDLTTTDGLEKLRKSNPEMYKAFVAAMNKKGTANPKVVQLRTAYNGDISKLTPNDIQKVKDIGGLRIQSFSDFETPHLLDMVQAVLDMSAVGLTAQAYTKVANFAWAFGDTGIKINLSLIGKGTGLDENGNLVFDNVEGINFDDAMKLRERYGKNVGTVLVGINDDHIIAAMADPRIDFIIPFHRSGWSDTEMRGLPTLHNYEDYTNSQNELLILEKKTVTPKKNVGRQAVDNWIAANADAHPNYTVTDLGNGKFTISYVEGYKTESFGTHEERTKEKLKNFEPVGSHGYWDFSKSGQENAETYLKMCADAGRVPKFSQFLVDNGDGTFSLPQGDDSRSKAIREGYWKTLIDFKMYDNEGNGAAQTAVTPNVNMDQAQRILNEHKLGRQMPNKSDGTPGAFIPMESNNDMPVAEPAGDEYIRRILAKRQGTTPENPNDPMEATPEIDVLKLKRQNGPINGTSKPMTGTAAMASGGETTLGNTETAPVEEPAAKQRAAAVDAETGEIRLRLPMEEAIETAFDDMYDEDLARELEIDDSTEESPRAVLTEAVEDLKDEFDPTIYNGRLYVKPDTLDSWLSPSGFASTNSKYAQAYITSMNPKDFLRMSTATREGQQRILNESTPLNEEQLGENAVRQPIQFIIDEEAGKITGHEGRHRAIALARAGVTQMPVLLFDNATKYSKEAKDSITLEGQDAYFLDAENGNTLTFQNVIPLNQENADLIREMFTANAQDEENAAENGQRVLRFQLPTDRILEQQIRRYLDQGGAAGVRAQQQTMPRIKEAKAGNPAPAQQQQQLPVPVTPGQQQARKVKDNLESPQRIAVNLIKRLGIGDYLDSNNFGRYWNDKGIYDPHGKYVAIKPAELGSIDTTGHEIGHAIGDKLGIQGTYQMVRSLYAANPAYWSQYDPGEMPDEAMAEFMWRYLDDEQTARNFSGDVFYDQFETRLRQHPDMWDAVQEARQQMQAFNAADFGEKIGSVIRYERGGQRKALSDRVREALAQMIDRSAAAEPLEHLVRQKTGKKKVDLSMSVRQNALLANHSTGMVERILVDDLVDINGVRIGDGLGKRMTDAGFKYTWENLQLLDEYMLAKHSIDRLRQHKRALDERWGTEAAAQAYTARIEMQRPDIANAAKAWQSFRNDFLKAWMVDTGYWSQDFLNELNRMYPNYVPTFRVKEEGSVSQDFNKSGIKRYMMHEAKGSSQDVFTPFASFIGMVDTMVTQAMNNRTAQVFDRLYNQYEGLGAYARVIEPTKSGMNSRQAQLFGLLNGMVSQDIMDQVLDITKGGTKDLVNGNVLTVQREDGSTVQYEIRDPEMFKLLAGVNANLGGDALGRVFSGIGAFTRMMTMLTTGSNPLFALRNATRDFQTSVNYGTWATSYLDGLWKWAKAFHEVWVKSDDVRAYEDLGGGGWTRVNQNKQSSIQNMAAEMFGDDRSTGTRTLKWLGKKLWNTITAEHINGVIEETSRFVEYKYGKHDLTTPEGRQEAFLAAQDVTVDFSRSGNSALAATVKKVVPFFSASLQGVYRTGRQFTEGESDRVGVRLAKNIVNTALASALANGLILRFSGDDDKEEYANLLSDNMKANHLILPNFWKLLTGDESAPPFIRIPLAQDPITYLVHGLVTNAIWKGAEDEVALDLAATVDVILDNLNPIGSGTVAQPFIDVSHNRTWFGTGLIGNSMKDWTDKAAQYNEDTPMIFRWLGRFTGQSPLVIQYLAEQYTGFVGSMAIPALSYDSTGNIGGWRAILNTATKKWTADPTSSNNMTGVFYKAVDDIENIIKVGNKGREQGLLLPTLSQEQVDQAYEEASKMTKKGGVIYEAKKVITDSYNKIDAIYANKNLTDNQKTIQVREVKREMIDAVGASYDEIEAYYRKYVTGETLLDRTVGQALKYLPGVQKTATIKTPEEEMPQVFQDDADEGYMKMATEMYEATGKAIKLPHPSQTFTLTDRLGNEHECEVPDEDWDQYVLAYRAAYMAYMNKKAARWGTMTEKQKDSVLSSAHRAGNEAMHKMYAVENDIPLKK